MLPLYSAKYFSCDECITIVEEGLAISARESSYELDDMRSVIPGHNPMSITKKASDENLAPLDRGLMKSTKSSKVCSVSTSTDHPAWQMGESLLLHHGNYRVKGTKVTQQVDISFFV